MHQVNTGFTGRRCSDAPGKEIFEVEEMFARRGSTYRPVKDFQRDDSAASPPHPFGAALRAFYGALRTPCEPGALNSTPTFNVRQTKKAAP